MAGAVSSSVADRLRRHFPAGQFVRYLCVGAFNTVFAYADFALVLYLLHDLLPQRLLYLAVLAALVVVFPVNVTVAYFGYKVFVFQTSGNYLREWLKCFAVYGSAALPSLLILPLLTKVLQVLFHRNSIALHGMLTGVEGHLHGGLLVLAKGAANGHALAGYLAGGIVTIASTLYSFLGHRNVTFRQQGV